MILLPSEREVENTVKLDVRAARIVAGLDPDQTNLMLQALAYVLMSKKTGKSIQSIVSTQVSSKQSKVSSTNQTRGSISKQTIKVDNSDDTKRVSGSGQNNNKSVKRQQESVRVSPNNNERKQTDLRPGSSRKSSLDSSHVEQNSLAKSYPKNSLADNKVSGRRNSSNIAQQTDHESPRHSAENKTSSSGQPIRPTTSSKPPPRAITKDELITTDTQPARFSLSRLDSITKDSDRNLSAINIKKNGEIKYFDDDSNKKTNNNADQSTTDTMLNYNTQDAQTTNRQDKITKSFVGEKVNNIEGIINKNELIKLMNYQDGLKKYNLKANTSLWNEQESSSNVEINNSDNDGKDKSVNESPSAESSNRKNSTTDQSVRIQEQTDQIKQSLKILTQFITPANKAVNFIFEDFDAIITEYERYLDRTDINKKSTSQVVNLDNSKLAMSRLNDLEIKIEEASDELNRLKTQLVQNDTSIRKKISLHVSTM